MRSFRARFFPLVVACLAILWVLAGLRQRPSPEGWNFHAFGRLPVLADGRVKNFDSLARGSLLALQGKQTVETPDGRRIGASEWLLHVLARPDEADTFPAFLVHHPDLLAMFGKGGESRHIFSFNDFRPHGAEIQQQAEMARELRREERSIYQDALLKLDYTLTLYWRLRHSLHFGDPEEFGTILDHHESVVRPIIRKMKEQPTNSLPELETMEIYQAAFRYASFSDLAQLHPIAFPHPDKPRGEWVSLGEAMTRSLEDVNIPPHVIGYKNIVESFARGKPGEFNGHVQALLSWKNKYFPEATGRARTEGAFNNLNLFLKSSVLYLGAFLFLGASWIGARSTTARTALLLLAVALVAHTIGLGLRMYIQERPPVTSLYASALFVGWGAVILGLCLERIYRNTMGATVAAVLGFLTLLIAHNLSNDGDNVEVMRAVLNSNFWLATHVVVITIGYAATFVAAGVGAAAIIRNLFGKGLSAPQARAASGMVYGIVCFALLFAFAGTVLGGIWADQSWGRFWGWDPKENGALLIVLWLATTLHLRWAGMIGHRGLMVCAVFGGIVTSFSWFGVNMLGVGLHSYGFMDGAFFWLGVFMASQLTIMGSAFLGPKRAIRTADNEQRDPSA